MIDFADTDLLGLAEILSQQASEFALLEVTEKYSEFFKDVSQLLDVLNKKIIELKDSKESAITIDEKVNELLLEYISIIYTASRVPITPKHSGKTMLKDAMSRVTISLPAYNHLVMTAIVIP